MLNIERILKNDRLLRATTGLNRKAFDNLLVDFRKVYQEEMENKETARMRKIGGGRKAKLETITEKLFYIKNKEKQKENYSGKKKRCTRKSLAGASEKKQILVLSPSTNGKKHDKKIHDQEDIIGGIPEEIPVLADLGFLGVQKQYDNIHLPHKKPKGGELTSEQKQENRELASVRVVCENAFAGVKRYNAVSDIYRNRVSDFDDKLILTACGLWNLYLEVA
jgi:hypothetical protein